MIPEEFADYLVEYHGRRDYFECHEILEEYWKEADPGNKNSHWVGFILLAVSAYHHRRKNFAGAERTMHKSIEILERTDLATISGLGMDYNMLINILKDSLQSIKARKPYASINLPISNPELLNRCKEKCEQKGCRWTIVSSIDDDIVHKHIRRDRSEVINERNRQKELRRTKK